MSLLGWSLTLSLVGCSKPVPPQAPAAEPVTAAFTVLSINDTYRIEGFQESGAGGMARVRTLRQELEAEGPVLVLHGGDLLYPSLLSMTFDGRQMVDVMGALDGDPDGFDDRLFVVFGNHEFDADDLEDAAQLDETIEAAGFSWLSSNITWVRGEDGAPLIAADNLIATATVELGGAQVGLVGVTGSYEHPEYVEAFADPLETLRREVLTLRGGGADFVIALTHLGIEEDLALLEALGDAGPDLIVGGHDHAAMIERASTGRKVVKGDSDARSAVVTRVRLEAGSAYVEPEITSLDMAVPPDPSVQAQVEAWLVEHERSFCADVGEEAPCLDDPLGHVSGALIAEESIIRSAEANLGSWVADLARDAYAGDGAQVALINSGSLRINMDLPAGAAFTRRHLEELLPYPSDLKLLRIDGAALKAAIAHGVVGWPGAGRWLQVSGLAFRHSPEGGVSEVSLVTADGVRAVTDEEEVLVVVGAYMEGGGDGYAMLQGAAVMDGGHTLRDLIVEALDAAGDVGITPPPAGRICQAGTACVLE